MSTQNHTRSSDVVGETPVEELNKIRDTLKVVVPKIVEIASLISYMCVKYHTELSRKQ